MKHLNTVILFILTISVSFMILFAYVSISNEFPSHQDGFSYFKIAKNFADGKGLTEDTIHYFYPRFNTIPHPMGNFFMPLSILITGYAFKIFGFSITVLKVIKIFITLTLCALIFIWVMKIYNDKLIASLSALVFASHPFVVGAVLTPELYHMFFTTIFCYVLAMALIKSDIYFLISGIMGGLTYLTRNEGIFCLLVIVLVFLYKKYKIDRSVRWTYLILSMLLFILVIFPWELRNILLFGKQAGWAKYNLFFAREYYDLVTFSKNPSLIQYIKDYLALGLKRILVIKSQSYFYEADTFAEITGWPVLLFLCVGLIKTIKMRHYLPVYTYFVITYIFMCFLNSVGQKGAWYATYTLLPFTVIISIIGCFYFAESVIGNIKYRKILGVILSLLVFSYGVGNVFKSYFKYKKYGGTNVNEYAMLVTDKIKNFHGSKNEEIIVMSHLPQIINFYTGLKGVQIPHGPFDEIIKVIRYYKSNYLVLYGTLPPNAADLYTGQKRVKWLKLIADIPNPALGMHGAGSRIKIYKIDLKKIEFKERLI